MCFLSVIINQGSERTPQLKRVFSSSPSIIPTGKGFFFLIHSLSLFPSTFEDLRTWGVGDALRQRCKLPLTNRIEEPLVREYNIFIKAENAKFCRQEVEAVKNKFPDKPVGGNQGHSIVYSDAVLSDISDYLFIENTAGTLYHIIDSTAKYRGLLAGGRHRKPLWAWCWSPTWHQNTRAYRIMIYEAWAQGVTPYLYLLTLAYDYEGGMGYYWMPNVTSELYEEGLRLATFAQQHRKLLRPAFRNEADVAVVYSVPFTGNIRTNTTPCLGTLAMN